MGKREGGEIKTREEGRREERDWGLGKRKSGEGRASKWARSPATGLSVGTRSGAPGGQLHLALGLSFVEAASPTSPLLPPPPLPCPRWAAPGLSDAYS